MRVRLILICPLCAVELAAQTNSLPATLEAEEKSWAFSGSVYTYVIPEGRDYAQPTITADHNNVHFEARYNYEALDTGSVWLGYKYSGGEKLAWEFTPMLGGAFGRTAGLAPGYKGSLSWWKLELYSEGEYFIDTEDREGQFFYNWSEFTISPVAWFRFGVVAQRTRAYQSNRDIQRGLLLGLSYKRLDLAGYVFNPDESKPIWVFAVTFNY